MVAAVHGISCAERWCCFWHTGETHRVVVKLPAARAWLEMGYGGPAMRDSGGRNRAPRRASDGSRDGRKISREGRWWVRDAHRVVYFGRGSFEAMNFR